MREMQLWVAGGLVQTGFSSLGRIVASPVPKSEGQGHPQLNRILCEIGPPASRSTAINHNAAQNQLKMNSKLSKAGEQFSFSAAC